MRRNDAGQNRIVGALLGRVGKWVEGGDIRVVDRAELALFAEDFAKIRACFDPAAGVRGLGHRLLRHVERCALLLIIVDMAGNDGRDPADDYRQLLNELKLYDPALLKKPRLLAANKMDLPDAAANLTRFRRGKAI